MVKTTLMDFNMRIKELEREKVYSNMIYETKKDIYKSDDE